MAQMLAADFPINPAVTNGTQLADITNRFQAATQTSNSGATAPASTFAGQIWLDMSTGANGVLKLRNAANAAWITLFDPASGYLPMAGGTLTGNLLVNPLAGVAAVEVKAAAGQLSTVRIAGNAQALGVQSLDVYQDQTNTAYINQRATLPMILAQANSERMRLDASGIGVTGAVRVSAGTVGVPAFSFTADSDTGIYLNTPGIMDFAVNGARMAYTHAGGFGSILDLAAGRDLAVLRNANITGQTVIGSNLSIGATTFIPYGSIGALSLAFTGDAGSGLYHVPGNAGVSIAAGGGTTASFTPGIASIYGVLQSASWESTADPLFRLYVQGNGRYAHYASGYYWEWNAATGNMSWISAGVVICVFQQDAAPGPSLLWRTGTAAKPGGGTWVDVSDARIKTNVADYPAGLAELVQLRPRTYNYTAETGRDTNTQHIGLIAQEAQPVMPELVSAALTAALPEVQLEEGEPPLLMLDASALTYALVNAVRELNARLTAIEGATP
jgi:hypothetical protein